MFSDAIILVAGANLGDRETILHSLRDDCHVLAAQNTEAALAHLPHSVSLVICDTSSSELDGIELLDRWKIRHPQTPFLMLINKNDVTTAVEAMRKGATNCIEKPIDPDELRGAAIELIQREEMPKSSGNGSDYRQKRGIAIPPDTSLEDLERAAVEQALVQHHGNRTHAARTLGISVRTLQRKLKSWGLPIVTFPHAGMSNSTFFPSSAAETTHSFSAHVH